MKKMSVPSFDFIEDDETKNATIIIYNIIIQNNLLNWVSMYTPKCCDTTHQLVAELAWDQGIEGILIGGSIMRVSTLAKDGYDELKREWIKNNKY